MHERVPQGVVTYLKNLYYDTALSTNSFTLRSFQELVDPSHILFGSDFPFLPEPVIAENILGLESYDGFIQQDRRKIERDNALMLLPHFK